VPPLWEWRCTQCIHARPRPEPIDLPSGSRTQALPNNVNTITVPNGAIRLKIWFQNGSGAYVRGRIGFQSEATPVPTAADTDTTLGHQEPGVAEYYFSSWAKYMCVASSTANAVVLGTWFYD
jgi:hypothetical protein